MLVLLLSLFLLVPSGHAAISNGAAAIDMLGQHDDSLTNPQPVYTKNGANNGPNRFGLNLTNASGSVAIDANNHRAFVADSANNRILVYSLNADHTLTDRIPDYILGQSVYYTNGASTTPSGLRKPAGIVYDGTGSRLFVVDGGNNRILVYSLSTLSNGMAATYVIGQTSFTASGASTIASGLRGPTGLAYDSASDHLFVADQGNNRVLVFTGSTLATGASAAYVLGQADFTSSTAATTQAGMTKPFALSYDGSGSCLFVSDQGNNRVLVFSGSTLSDGMNAAKVLGQTTFTASTAANTQAGMNVPRGISYDSSGQRLFVAQSGNHRVTVYDVASITDGETATNVLGQSLFTTATAASTQLGLNNPRGITFDPVSENLFVSQAGNHRISVFDLATITNGENAVDLLGQYDDSLTDPQPVYTKGGANNGPNRLGLSLDGVATNQLVFDEVHHRLFVSDTYNSRVLVYNLNADNSLEDHIPDYVLGQPNFHSNAGAATPAGISQPNGIAYDSQYNRLFVSSTNMSRIVVYDVASITSGEDAVYVLGPTSLTGTSGGTSQSQMNWQRGLAFDVTNQRLFVADVPRVLVFVFTGGVITNGMNASAVIGQTSFTTNTLRPVSASSFGAYGIAYDEIDQRLFVADTSYGRVLVFDVSSITNGEDAVHVLGQPDFTTSSTAVFSIPRALAYDANNQRLFVASLGHNRVLVFDVASIADGEDPTYVLGQPDFTSTSRSTTASAATPQGVTYDRTNDRIYVADRSNNRIMIFEVTPEVVASTTPEVSLTPPPAGGGRGSRSPGREGTAPLINPSTRSLLPTQPITVSPLYGPVNQVPPAPTGIVSPLRDRLAARIEKRITQYPRLRTTLLRMLQRLDRRLQMR